jgi:hypothetical protein
MDPRLAQLLDGTLDLTTLNPDDLRALRAQLDEAFREADPGADGTPDDDVLNRMTAIADATEQVQVELAGRVAGDERVSRAEELRRRHAAVPAAPEPVALVPPVEPDPEPAAAEVDVPDSPVELEPVAAAATVRPTLGQLAQRTNPTPPARTRPRRIEANTALTAAANMPGLGLGAPVDWADLARSTHQKLRQLRAATHPEQHVCASVTWEYPEDRRLGMDADVNTQILNRTLSPRAIVESVEDQGGLGAVVAAGGICGPLPIDYDLIVDSVASRPLRDSLPSYQAVRGGITFNPSPTFASVGTSATAVWTAANDANPTSPSTKPVQTFACPSPTSVYVDAIPTRVQFSNFQERYSPEFVQANTQLALANAARIAELNLLSKMATGSTQIGAGTLVSFTRDLMALLDLQANAYRYRHRLPNGENGQPMFPLRFVAPSWVKGAMRTDFLRETAHDRDGATGDNLALADSYISNLFAARGIVPSWTMDGLGKSTAGGTLSAAGSWDYPDQSFGAPATTAALSAAPPDLSANSSVAGTWWPTRLTFFLFAEGTWVFLDGGRIDLGVIRDSVLNNTNQYQEFVEPIEGLAKRGYESQQITVPTRLTGTSISTITAPAASAMVY